MSKYRIWTISILLLFAAFASIGVFEPTLTLSSSFLVNRSAATTFRVLTQPASLNELVENVSKIEPLVEHKDNIGNRYRILLGEKGSSSELEGKLIQFVDLEQFSYLYTTHSVEIEVSYTLVRAETATIVQVARQVFPQSWWRRSFLPLVSRAEAAKKIRINDRLVKSIESSPESLIGDWISTGSDGIEQMFSFRSDGTVDWRVALGASVFPLSGLHWQRKRPYSLNSLT